MSLLNLFKSKEKDSIVSFLEKADDAYRQAYEYSDVSGLEGIVSVQLLRRLMSEVKYKDKVYAGLKRYENVKWSKSTQISEEVACYSKDVFYDDIKFSHDISCPVGQAYKELWYIDIPQMLITNIERREDGYNQI